MINKNKVIGVTNQLVNNQKSNKKTKKLSESEEEEEEVIGNPFGFSDDESFEEMLTEDQEIIEKIDHLNKDVTINRGKFCERNS